MPHWNGTLWRLDCQARADLADHATPKLQSRVTTFTSQLIYQFNTFFDRVWFANDQLCERYISMLFWSNLTHFWLRGVALKSRHATWPFRQGITSKSTALINYSFYSISLSLAAMDLQIQGDIRRSKRKLSIFLDLPDSSSFSQNPLVSTPAEKKKKISSFSQIQPTRNIQKISIYSESPLSEDSESAIRTRKS